MLQDNGRHLSQIWRNALVLDAASRPRVVVGMNSEIAVRAEMVGRLV